MRYVLKIGGKKRERAAVKSRESDGGELEMNTLESVRERFSKQGLKFLGRPRGSSGELLNPKLPPDLTALNDVRLGRLFGEFCLMAQYCQLRIAAHAVTKSACKAAEKYVRAETRLRKDGTVPDKEAQVEIDSRVRKRALATLTGEGVETLTSAMMQSYLIGRDACSREMTRRQFAFKQDGSSHR